MSQIPVTGNNEGHFQFSDNINNTCVVISAYKSGCRANILYYRFLVVTIWNILPKSFTENLYLFIFPREKETESQADSTLSMESYAGLILMTPRSRPEQKPRFWHPTNCANQAPPGAPTPVFLVCGH